MKRQTSLFLFAVTLFLFGCSGKESTSQENNKMMSEVYKICPKADVVNVENKFESVEIEFLCDDNPISLVFDKQGNLLYKETNFKPTEDFLRKATKKIQKSHAGWIIDEISLIENTDTSFVKIEVIKNGVEENLFFTVDGKFYKFKNYITTEIWSENSLRESEYYKTLPYDFLNSKRTFDVPEVLKEISGISVVGDTSVFCIQDELGAVFQIDLRDESLATVGRFTDVGDFEDVQAVGDSVVILRSDGTLFSFAYDKFNGRANQIMMNVPCMNMEGLYYDKSIDKYLVSCKEPSMGLRSTNKKQHQQDLLEYADRERMIYAFDKKNVTKPESYLAIRIEDVRDFVKEHYKIDSVANITFNPSALARNPISNELYVLSASQRMILVYDNQTLKNVMLLVPEDFYKPEGLDFLSNGDMVICSEGMKKGYLQGQITVVQMKK